MSLMIISALVVTWHIDSSAETVPEDPRVTYGPRSEQRQAVITEAADYKEAEDIYRWLENQAEVAFVELVSAQEDEDGTDDVIHTAEDLSCPQ